MNESIDIHVLRLGNRCGLYNDSHNSNPDDEQNDRNPIEKMGTFVTTTLNLHFLVS
jgi:hypothetical protein